MKFEQNPDIDLFFLGQDLLGPSLEDLLNFCKGRLSLKTVRALSVAPGPVQWIDRGDNRASMRGEDFEEFSRATR